MSGSKGQEIVYTWARLNTPTHKELSDTIDAALRRAKAEGLGEAVKLCTILENHYAERSAGNRVAEIQRLAVGGVRNSILDRMDELDARAAKIEEGGDHGINR